MLDGSSESAMCTEPPTGVYLSALLKMLRKTSRSLVSSQMTVGCSTCVQRVKVMPFSAICESKSANSESLNS